MRRKRKNKTLIKVGELTEALASRIVIFLLFIVALLPAKLNAQCESVNNAFKPGEYLEYDLYFNWKFIWSKAGKAVMSTTKSYFNSEPVYKVDLYAVGNKKADFFFKMRDTLTSVVSRKLQPRYFRKGALEGSRYTVDEAFFSYKDDSVTVEQQRYWRKKDKEKRYNMSYTSSECVHDMLSILLQARSFDPTNYYKGQRFLFEMATGRKVEEQTLIFRGRENFKAKNKTVYRCLVFSLVEYKKGKEKEVITFYITDDKNHLPVRLDLFLNFGSAKAFLKTVKGNRHPFDSIIKEN